MSLLPNGHPHKVCQVFEDTLVIQKHTDVKLEARPDGSVSMTCFSRNLVLVIELDEVEKAALVDHLCGLPINPVGEVEDKRTPFQVMRSFEKAMNDHMRGNVDDAKRGA